MPIIPTGGLSIFLNLAILLVGFLVKTLKKTPIKVDWLHSFFALFTEKRFNTRIRRTFGYGISATICSLMIYTTSYSLYQRLNSDSNFDVFYETRTLIDTRVKPVLANINVRLFPSHQFNSYNDTSVEYESVPTIKFKQTSGMNFVTNQSIHQNYPTSTPALALYTHYEY